MSTRSADDIKTELQRLDAKYKKTMARQEKSAWVPPSIKTAALARISDQMDKLDAELARLEGGAEISK